MAAAQDARLAMTPSVEPPAGVGGRTVRDASLLIAVLNLLILVLVPSQQTVPAPGPSTASVGSTPAAAHGSAELQPIAMLAHQCLDEIVRRVESPVDDALDGYGWIGGDIHTSAAAALTCAAPSLVSAAAITLWQADAEGHCITARGIARAAALVAPRRRTVAKAPPHAAAAEPESTATLAPRQVSTLVRPRGRLVRHRAAAATPMRCVQICLHSCVQSPAPRVSALAFATALLAGACLMRLFQLSAFWMPACVHWPAAGPLSQPVHNRGQGEETAGGMTSAGEARWHLSARRLSTAIVAPDQDNRCARGITASRTIQHCGVGATARLPIINPCARLSASMLLQNRHGRLSHGA